MSLDIITPAYGGNNVLGYFTPLQVGEILPSRMLLPLGIRGKNVLEYYYSLPIGVIMSYDIVDPHLEG